MSGIGAIFYKSGHDVQRHEIERVAKALRIYGRHYQAVKLMGQVAFAYTHFTSSTEPSIYQQKHQLLSDISGRYTFVFDGRIDNRADLGSSLGIKPATLKTLSDASLALCCWEKWGTKALQQWIGEYACICWDNIERSLIAARDPLGRRALHYYEDGNSLVVASSPKGIYALEQCPMELDAQKIADVLSNHYIDERHSFFKNIYCIQAGHFLKAAHNKTDHIQHYQLENQVREVRYTSDNDYVEAARELFDQAVASCMRTSGKVGAFMSGGLDSSSVAVTATKFLNNKQDVQLPCYTWVPEQGWDGLTEANCYGDETPYVKAIAQQHELLDTHFITAQGLNHFHKQDALFNAMDMPVRNVMNMAWFHAILDAARNDGVSVMLTGEMGNATLSHAGTGAMLHLWQNNEYAKLLREFNIAYKNKNESVSHLVKQLLLQTSPDWLWNLKEKYRGRSASSKWQQFSAINKQFGRNQGMPERLVKSGFNFYGKPKSLARQNESWKWLLQTQAMTQTGAFLQGFRAMYGIEMRDPFADRRLLEWCLGVPESQYNRNGQSRWLIKRLMQTQLPETVLYKPKDVGRQMSDWHIRLTRDLPRMRKELAEFALDKDIKQMIDIPRLTALLNNWPRHTITETEDDRRILLPAVLPHALQVGSFIQHINSKL